MRATSTPALLQYGVSPSVVLLLLSALLLAGCATAPPKQVDNLCTIFAEKRHWHSAAKEAEDRWKTSVPVLMAIIHQESRFRADARPPRQWFWIIPLGRPSNAYGYAQVLDGTWEEYQDSTGKWFADRDDFEDAVDFVGWYSHRSYVRNKIRRDDAYHLYLAYHEGHGGFERRSFRDKHWLKKVATKVSARANLYRQQYLGCAKSLNKSSWFF